MNKQTYTYKIVAGCRIQADVYQIDTGKKQPAVVWIHGGALVCGSRSAITAYQVKKYLDFGFTIISIDYRLAPETKLPAIIEDIKDAFEWVYERGPELFAIDPEQISVVGHSAGGYLALMAGFVTSPRPRRIVTWYGYGDIVGPWYSQPDPWYGQKEIVSEEKAYAAVGQLPIVEGDCNQRSPFYLYCRQHGLWPEEIAGQDPQKNRDWFSGFCPIQNVTSAYPPTMLIHGDQDTDVPYERSVEMDAVLTIHQVVHKLLILSGCEHGFADVEELKADSVVSGLFNQMCQFLKE